MDKLALNAFCSGAFALACLAVALFFFRFWRKSQERLFAILCSAFALLALERTVLASVPAAHESRHWIYLARLVAFALIIIGVLDKNRPARLP
ncbi:MAG: DUF5985 family protein [Deltaproteobacteria bacterium]|nr:DUF5985 family protein [Deltaproteobacteria bacterium]